MLKSNEWLPDRHEHSFRVRPARFPNIGVKNWLESTDLDLQYVSVITLAEIKKGIELHVEGKRRSQLEAWLKSDLEEWFAGKILSIDRRVTDEWAMLTVRGYRSGRPLPTLDSLIAATALAHNLTVVTRNTRDFESSGVHTHNPWIL